MPHANAFLHILPLVCKMIFLCSVQTEPRFELQSVVFSGLRSWVAGDCIACNESDGDWGRWSFAMTLINKNGSTDICSHVQEAKDGK